MKEENYESYLQTRQGTQVLCDIKGEEYCVKLALCPFFARNFQAQKTLYIDNDKWYYQLIALKHSVFNLYQRVSSISLEKENVKSNFININGDFNCKNVLNVNK